MNNFCPIFKKMSIFFSESSEKLLYALLITQILKNDYYKGLWTRDTDMITLFFM
jgi:hypothetical protein